MDMLIDKVKYTIAGDAGITSKNTDLAVAGTSGLTSWLYGLSF